jgi:SAM-dependent methyltransferase
VGVPDAAQLARFYDAAYSEDPDAAERHSHWRALGAVGKAGHVVELCERARISPASTLEVGCGDGALLCALAARGFGGELHGVEISQAAVEIARRRAQIRSVSLYDGARLPAADQAYELGVLSHVLEHVEEPAALLAEAARACAAIVVEVPLEANWSARRQGKRRHAIAVGHLQRFDRRSVRAAVSRAGLSVAAELQDPLPREVHSFFAVGASGHARAGAKWALRGVLHRLSPALARRVFTVHYACLCLPAG